MKPAAVLFGIPIDHVTMNESLDQIERFVINGRAHGHTYQVATVNVDFLVNALEHPDVHAILRRADLCLADGSPIVWAARGMGIALPERVTGADMVPALFERAARRQFHVHIFGGAPTVAERARSLVLSLHPNAIVSAQSGVDVKANGSCAPSAIARMEMTNADIVLVALGNPKQERFIERYRGCIRSPVFIGIGGSLDMMLGDRRRSPEVIQQVGAEWLFRAGQEPIRLGRRYAHDIRMLGPKAARLARAIDQCRGGRSLTVVSNGRHAEVHTSDREDRQAWESFEPVRHHRIHIDVSDAMSLTPLAQGLLANTVRATRRTECIVSFTGLDTARSTLDKLGTTALLELTEGQRRQDTAAIPDGTTSVFDGEVRSAV